MEQIERLEQFIRAGDLAGALDYIETLSQEDRRRWEIQNLIGVVCSYCGQFEKAEEFFSAALEQQPENLNLLYNLADTCIALGKKRDAEELLRRCEHLDSAGEMAEDLAALRERLGEPEGKKVLMAAYYFPPLSGSGVFRSLKFAKYLPELGWKPTVISTDRPPDGWKFEDQSQVAEIPAFVEVMRIPDRISTGRENSISSGRAQALLNFLRGVLRYSPEADNIFSQVSQFEKGIIDLLTFPCTALSWAYDVVQYIEENIDLKQYQVIYTTSGPQSAHLIGFYLKQKYGIPWVADYRDFWTYNPYSAKYDPSNPRQKLFFELESILLHQADCNLTIADSAVKIYTDHFNLPRDQIVSITNGYDEADFTGLTFRTEKTDMFTINYSGLLYTNQESIAPILCAIQQLGAEKKIDISQVRFRITGVGVENYTSIAKKYGLEQIMVETGYLSHSDALQSNLDADILLLLVGDDIRFKPIFTGKFFDYLRSGKPILALAPKGGEVAKVLRETGHGEAFLSTQTGQIKAMILREYRKWQTSGTNEFLHSPKIERFERKVLTEQLVEVLERVSDNGNWLTDTVSQTLDIQRLIPSAKYLVICNGGYPMEGNPRCMFAHERVLQYVKAGLEVEAFGFIWGAPLTTYTYQGIQVTQGGAEELQRLLQSGNYKKLLIHFADVYVMYAIQQAGKLDMPMIVWCHGYEVLPWHRCWFNFSREEIKEKQAEWNKGNEAKKKFLSQLFTQKNVHFIFISNWQLLCVKKFVGTLPDNRTVVPNFINTEFYESPGKTAQDRLHILSIKSHAAKTYANDITAKAIIELSTRPWFRQLTFEIYGDGNLFEENFHDLMEKKFPNVHIHKKILSHDEMRSAFRKNGILLAPTRYDTQGVTAGEGMSAGLAVISCNTAAVPEFIDEDCGSLFEFNNYWMMADEIEYLYFYPEEFLRKSQNAVQRVRRQCGYDATIRKEIQLITDGTRGAAVQSAHKGLKPVEHDIGSLHPYDRKPDDTFSSKNYWENRYAHGGTSGAGSYHRLAAFKAEVINTFIQDHQIASMIEWGCGDGNQLGLFLPVPYTGYDVSKTAVEICSKRYPAGEKKFVWYDGSRQSVEKRDLALSLDVVYHLVEDNVFETYMHNLFASSKRYVCIYSSNFDMDLCPHQKNRNFTRYIEGNFPNWKQIAFIKNRYPYNSQDPENTSLSDFYIYEHI